MSGVQVPLNHRMDHGPLPEDEARALLLTWWKGPAVTGRESLVKPAGRTAVPLPEVG